MYYTIQDNSILIADTEEALTRFYNNAYPLPDDYIEDKYIIEEGELVPNPNWEEEEAQKEAERIAQLHLTRGDVFRALLMARQVTRAQLRAMIEQMPVDEMTKELALIDFDEALDFYRGIALVDTLGLALGITEEQMTEFFETNDWHVLIPDARNKEGE